MKVWRIEVLGRELFRVEAFDDDEDETVDEETVEEDEDDVIYARLAEMIPCESCGEMFDPDEDVPTPSPLSWGQRLVWDIDTPTKHPFD